MSDPFLLSSDDVSLSSNSVSGPASKWQVTSAVPYRHWLDFSNVLRLPERNLKNGIYVKVYVICDVTPCCVTLEYRRFRRTCCLHRQGSGSSRCCLPWRFRVAVPSDTSGRPLLIWGPSTWSPQPDPETTLDTVFLLGAFAKLRKASVGFVMSVRLSAWKNSAPTWRIFTKFGIWAFFLEKPIKIQVSLKSDKLNRYFTWRPVYIYDNISLNYS